MWNTYRTESILWFALEFVRIVILYFFWNAVFQNSTSQSISGYTLEEMIGYIFISSMVYSYTSNDVLHSLSSMIKRGEVTQLLIKPIDFQTSFLMEALGNKLMILILNIIPMIFAIYFLNIPHPKTIGNWVTFFISLFIAGLIHFYYEFCVSLLSFYMTNLWGIEITNEAVFEFFSGALIPLTFFPEKLITICHYLPFEHIIFTPVNIFIGKISPDRWIEHLQMEILWAIIMLIMGRVLLKQGLKRVVIHGG
jgi:ABC-2 type transport system permease protein